MSHNNYFTTIKRRIHPYMNNRGHPSIFSPQTENHRIFSPGPPPSTHTKTITARTSDKSSSEGPRITPHTFKIHLNYHLTEVNSSILYHNTQVNSDNSGTSEKSLRIAPTHPPLLDALTLNKSSCEIYILRQISRKNLNFTFPSL